MLTHRWPRLGSRLIFELWEAKGNYILKIIYNGKDITKRTFFCAGFSLCLKLELNRVVTYVIRLHEALHSKLLGKEILPWPGVGIHFQRS